MWYHYLYSEITNVGFMQLIQNYYGDCIFSDPFPEILRSWGAKKIADIVDEAGELYLKYKSEIDSCMSIEDLVDLYDRLEEFRYLNNKFYGVMDAETKILRRYIESNISDFAEVVD